MVGGREGAFNVDQGHGVTEVQAFKSNVPIMLKDARSDHSSFEQLTEEQFDNLEASSRVCSPCACRLLPQGCNAGQS